MFKIVSYLAVTDLNIKLLIKISELTAKLIYFKHKKMCYNEGIGGNFQSFNYNNGNGQFIQNQNYAVCFRQEEGKSQFCFSRIQD
jgi:hypothetical protein